LVRCPTCRETHFVLPRSPLPPVELEEGAPPMVPGASWRTPLLAAGLTLLLVAGGLVTLFIYLSRPSDGGKDQAASGSTEDAITEGRRLLGEGSFQTALRTLKGPYYRGERGSELMQLLRQADLLAGLSQFSLQEIIQKGQLVRSDKEWKEQFGKEYSGRSLLFDDLVTREADGRHRLVHYEVVVEDEKAEVRLNLNLLKQLPITAPRRLLFGAKLASVERQGEKSWLVEFDPKSGVLLTDEGAATALGLGPVDVELHDLLLEQAGWARKLRD
jgi:hypothetical protein